MKLYCHLSFSTDTVRQMIVDESRSLQVGVADGRSEKLESSFFHILAHGIGFGRLYRNLTQGLKGIDNRLSAGKERQGIFIETTELLLYGKE